MFKMAMAVGFLFIAAISRSHRQSCFQDSNSRQKGFRITLAHSVDMTIYTDLHRFRYKQGHYGLGAGILRVYLGLHRVGFGFMYALYVIDLS